MIAQLLSIGILILFAAMLPGPDFAVVTKNTLLYSRRAGIFTSIGIACANLVHITYCSLGLAIVISQSLLLFGFIKYAGSIYLVYLGIKTLNARTTQQFTIQSNAKKNERLLSRTAFIQGFLCNVLNPKATLFFLALFTVVIKPQTPIIWGLIFAAEMFLIVITWFCVLSIFLSHAQVIKILAKAEKYILKSMGIALLGFGISLALFKQ